MSTSNNKITNTYTPITELSPEQTVQLHCLYQKQWWSANRSLTDTKKILANSSLIFAVVDENKELVAFCRVLTDRCFFAYIYDVIVKEEHRGNGLGDSLINAVIHHPDSQSLSSIELVCRKESIPFYQKNGFSTDYGKSVAMRLKLETAVF